MGRLQLECLGGQDKVYGCGRCYTYLTNSDNLISRQFQGASGTAFLFNLVVNIRTGKNEEKTMMTGAHYVRDIACKICGLKLGWMYELARNQDQIYKEGHYILEIKLISEMDGLTGDPNFVPHVARRFPRSRIQAEMAARNLNEESADEAFFSLGSSVPHTFSPLDMSTVNPIVISSTTRSHGGGTAVSLQNFSAILHRSAGTGNRARGHASSTADLTLARYFGGGRTSQHRSAHSNVSPNTARSGRHPLPVSNSSALSSRRNLRNIPLFMQQLSNTSSSSGSASSVGARTMRQNSSQGIRSRSSTTSMTSIASASTTSSSSGVENASTSATASSATSDAAINSSSASATPEDDLSPTQFIRHASGRNAQHRRLSIDANPTRGANNNTNDNSVSTGEEQRQLRFGRRAARFAGTR